MATATSTSGEHTASRDAKEFPELLSFVDLEELTGIPQSTWRGMRYAGTGPKSMKIGRRVYVDKADALAWLNSHREDTAA